MQTNNSLHTLTIDNDDKSLAKSLAETEFGSGLSIARLSEHQGSLQSITIDDDKIRTKEVFTSSIDISFLFAKVAGYNNLSTNTKVRLNVNKSSFKDQWKETLTHLNTQKVQFNTKIQKAFEDFLDKNYPSHVVELLKDRLNSGHRVYEQFHSKESEHFRFFLISIVKSLSDGRTTMQELGHNSDAEYFSQSLDFIKLLPPSDLVQTIDKSLTELLNKENENFFGPSVFSKFLTLYSESFKKEKEKEKDKDIDIEINKSNENSICFKMLTAGTTSVYERLTWLNSCFARQNGIFQLLAIVCQKIKTLSQNFEALSDFNKRHKDLTFGVLMLLIKYMQDIITLTRQLETEINETEIQIKIEKIKIHTETLENLLNFNSKMKEDKITNIIQQELINFFLSNNAKKLIDNAKKDLTNEHADGQSTISKTSSLETLRNAVRTAKGSGGTFLRNLSSNASGLQITSNKKGASKPINTKGSMITLFENDPSDYGLDSTCGKSSPIDHRYGLAEGSPTSTPLKHCESNKEELTETARATLDLSDSEEWHESVQTVNTNAGQPAQEGSILEQRDAEISSTLSGAKAEKINTSQNVGTSVYYL